MLYQIGTVALDTRPFAVDSVERAAGADFAGKPVMGRLQPREFMGEGDDKMTLAGQLVPTKIGGLGELEALHALRRKGQRLPVMRGDGKMLGWFVIEDIRESHALPMADGIGFTVGHSIGLARTAPDEPGSGIIDALLSLFDVLKG